MRSVKIISYLSVISLLILAGSLCRGEVIVPGQQENDALRVLSEEGAVNAREVVTQGDYAYVATGHGMNVIDIANPARPETVARFKLAPHLDSSDFPLVDEIDVEVLDVKVDRHLAVLANNKEFGPGGIAVVDVSDPTAPKFQSFYTPRQTQGSAQPQSWSWNP